MAEVAAAVTTIGVLLCVAIGAVAKASGVRPKPASTSILSLTTISWAMRRVVSATPASSFKTSSILRPATVEPFCAIQSLIAASICLPVEADCPVMGRMKPILNGTASAAKAAAAGSADTKAEMIRTCRAWRRCMAWFRKGGAGIVGRAVPPRIGRFAHIAGRRRRHGLACRCLFSWDRFGIAETEHPPAHRRHRRRLDAEVAVGAEGFARLGTRRVATADADERVGLPELLRRAVRRHGAAVVDVVNEQQGRVDRPVVESRQAAAAPGCLEDRRRQDHALHRAAERRTGIGGGDRAAAG